MENVSERELIEDEEHGVVRVKNEEKFGHVSEVFVNVVAIDK